MELSQKPKKHNRPLCFQVIGWGGIVALILEAITIFFRFGLGLQSSRDTQFLAPYTLGIRIHHGYIGILFLLLGWRAKEPSWQKGWWILGLGLLISDLLHHFVVLWWTTGSPHFDLVYPNLPH